MKLGKAATRQEAKLYTGIMMLHFRCRIVSRADAVEWQMLRAAVLTATAGKVDVEKLAGRFSFTLGPFVYLKPGMTPDETIEVVTHECEHVQQFWDGGLGYAFLYTTKGEARARYEAYAYAAGDEISWARFRRAPSPGGFSPLDGVAYLLTAAQKKFARKILQARGLQTVRGVVKSKAATVGIALLRAKLPHLLVR